MKSDNLAIARFNSSSPSSTRTTSDVALQTPEESEAAALLLQNHLHKVRNHRYTNPECSSVDDLQQLVDPTLPHNSYIPVVLSQNDINIADRYTCYQSRPAEPLILSYERMQDCRFRKLFEGRESDSTQPQNVCLHLHTSSRLARPPTRAVDTDSACGFTTSLGAFLNGLNWVMKPHRVRNMSSNIHGVHLSLQTEDSYGKTRQSSIPIHKVPHIHLGTGVGLLKIEAFVLFPRISDRTSNFLLDSEEEIWYDEIWMPALIQTIPSDEFQEIPTSWKAAAAKSRAKSFYRDTPFKKLCSTASSDSCQSYSSFNISTIIALELHDHLQLHR